MLKNLEQSLEFLFGDQGTVALSKGILTLRLGYTEIGINEEGRIVDASGGRPAGLEVHIDDPGVTVPAAGAAVAPVV